MQNGPFFSVSGFFSFGRLGMNGIVRSIRFTSLHQAVERPSSWQQDRFCPITRRPIEALEKCSAARLSATGTPSKRQQVHLFDWHPRSQTNKRRGEPLNLVLSWNVERKPIRRAVISSQAAHERRDRTLQHPSPQHPVFEKHAARLVGEVDHSVSAHLGEPYRPKPGPCFSGEQHHGIMPGGRLLDLDVSI